MGSSATYQVPPHVELVLRPVGDDVAVYNCASGATHVLDQGSAAILAVFLQAEQSRESLASATPPLPVAQDNLEKYLDHALAQFLELGLVEEAGEKTVDS